MELVIVVNLKTDVIGQATEMQKAVSWTMFTDPLKKITKW